MIKQAILDYVRQYDYVSFAELDRMEGFRGNCMWGVAERNIWFWFSVSPEAGDALTELIEEASIELVPSSLLLYLIDGCLPTVPMARRAHHTYKEPRWGPVVLRPSAKPFQKGAQKGAPRLQPMSDVTQSSG
jgi:hypothetical protein